MRRQMHRQRPVSKIVTNALNWIEGIVTHFKIQVNICTVVSKTSSTRGDRIWIGLGSSCDANSAPSLPSVIITVLQPRHRKLMIARFASLKYIEYLNVLSF